MSLRSAILGFLEIEPTSGYTLKQRFDGSVRSFWSATQSQIYRELHALERKRLVRVESVRGKGKPDRKVYSLTEAGRTALAAWLAEPLEPLELRHPLLLKLVFAADLPPKTLDGILAAYAQGMEATRAEYTDRLGDERIFALARSPRERAIWRLSIEHGVAWCDAELRWVAGVRTTLGTDRGGPTHGPKGQGDRGDRRVGRHRARQRPRARPRRRIRRPGGALGRQAGSGGGSHRPRQRNGHGGSDGRDRPGIRRRRC
jgi:DNA-binding PadR family transcriptional regulator